MPLNVMSPVWLRSLSSLLIASAVIALSACVGETPFEPNEADVSLTVVSPQKVGERSALILLPTAEELGGEVITYPITLVAVDNQPARRLIITNGSQLEATVAIVKHGRTPAEDQVEDIRCSVSQSTRTLFRNECLVPALAAGDSLHTRVTLTLPGRERREREELGLIGTGGERRESRAASERPRMTNYPLMVTYGPAQIMARLSMSSSAPSTWRLVGTTTERDEHKLEFDRRIGWGFRAIRSPGVAPRSANLVVEVRRQGEGALSVRDAENVRVRDVRQTNARRETDIRVGSCSWSIRVDYQNAREERAARGRRQALFERGERGVRVERPEQLDTSTPLDVDPETALSRGLQLYDRWECPLTSMDVGSTWLTIGLRPQIEGSFFVSSYLQINGVQVEGTTVHLGMLHGGRPPR